MKYLKLFEDWDITKIKKNSPGKYQYLDGVKYKIRDPNTTVAVPIKMVFHTEGNDYHKSHIDKYVEYIKNGGIIETLPVTEIGIVSNLYDMLEWLDDSDNYNIALDIIYPSVLIKPVSTSVDTILGKQEFKYVNQTPIKYLNEIFEEDEHPEYKRVNKDAKNINEVFPDNNLTPIEIELKSVLEKVFEYFDENKEYHLLDFNHRLWALEALGKKNVLVDVID